MRMQRDLNTLPADDVNVPDEEEHHEPLAGSPSKANAVKCGCFSWQCGNCSFTIVSLFLMTVAAAALYYFFFHDEIFGENDVESIGSPATLVPTTAPSAVQPLFNAFGENKKVGGTADPHFVGWNTQFSYQGSCDLVFIQTDILSVHVRTSFADERRRFSFISNVALTIGGDVVEVRQDKSYFVNGEPWAALPVTIGGAYSFAFDGSSFRLSLAGGQMLLIRFFRNTITMDLRGHVSDFGDTVGFAGSFRSNQLLGRDGTTIYPMLEIDDFADQWQVNASLGDDMLFVEPSTLERKCLRSQTFTPASTELERAQQECLSLSNDEVAMQNCIFDTLASGETGWSLNPGYTDPIGPAEAQCIAADDLCAARGGSCVWRCSTFEYECLPNLCTNNVEAEVKINASDCACGVPITASPSTDPSQHPDQPPSMMPSFPTSFPPVVSSNSQVPSVGRETLNDKIPCMSVIDETEINGPPVETFEVNWETFRKRYPLRPFCLLQPGPNPLRANPQSELAIPDNFLADNNTIYSQVARDMGDESIRSDWFELCGFSELRQRGITEVAVFIDNTSTWEHVQSSYTLFGERLEQHGILEVAGVSNRAENWIRPFFGDF